MVIISIFFASAILGIIFPLHLRRKRDKVAIFIPLVALACFFSYESLNDPGANIRVDWLVMIPMLLASLVAMLIRISILVTKGRSREERNL